MVSDAGADASARVLPGPCRADRPSRTGRSRRAGAAGRRIRLRTRAEAHRHAAAGAGARRICRMNAKRAHASALPRSSILVKRLRGIRPKRTSPARPKKRTCGARAFLAERPIRTDLRERAGFSARTRLTLSVCRSAAEPPLEWKIKPMPTARPNFPDGRLGVNFSLYPRWQATR